MSKGITGLDRAQLSRLMELVVRDEEVALAPRILSPLAAVQATLIYLLYLRTSTCQEAIAEIKGAPAHDLADDRGDHPVHRHCPRPGACHRRGEPPQWRVHHRWDPTALLSWKDQPGRAGHRPTTSPPPSTTSYQPVQGRIPRATHFGRQGLHRGRHRPQDPIKGTKPRSDDTADHTIQAGLRAPDQRANALHR